MGDHDKSRYRGPRIPRLLYLSWINIVSVESIRQGDGHNGTHTRCSLRHNNTSVFPVRSATNVKWSRAEVMLSACLSVRTISARAEHDCVTQYDSTNTLLSEFSCGFAAHVYVQFHLRPQNTYVLKQSASVNQPRSAKPKFGRQPSAKNSYTKFHENQTVQTLQVGPRPT